MTRLGSRGRHEEQPVVAEHTNECADVAGRRMVDGGRVVGEPVAEAVVQAGRHVGHAPDVAVRVEHQVVHRGEARAMFRAGLATLLQPLPAKGEPAAVMLVLRDLVQTAGLLGGVHRPGQLGDFEDARVRIAVPARRAVGEGDEHLARVARVDLEILRACRWRAADQVAGVEGVAQDRALGRIEVGQRSVEVPRGKSRECDVASVLRSQANEPPSIVCPATPSRRGSRMRPLKSVPDVNPLANGTDEISDGRSGLVGVERVTGIHCPVPSGW